MTRPSKRAVRAAVLTSEEVSRVLRLTPGEVRRLLKRRGIEPVLEMRGAKLWHLDDIERVRHQPRNPGPPTKEERERLSAAPAHD